MKFKIYRGWSSDLKRDYYMISDGEYMCSLNKFTHQDSVETLIQRLKTDMPEVMIHPFHEFGLEHMGTFETQEDLKMIFPEYFI